MARRVVWVYCFFRFMFGLSHSFFFATYVLFLSDAGLGLLEINFINAVFMISSFFMEVPTGLVADIYGRKRSFVLSCLVISLSFLIYFISTSFTMFLIAEIVASVGAALYSGSFKAWVADEVKHYGRVDYRDRAFRGGMISSKSGEVIGVSIGGYLGALSLALPWLVSSVSLLLTGVLAMVIIGENGWTKTPREAGVSALGNMRNISLSEAKTCLKNTELVFAGLACFVFGAAIMALNMYWQLHYTSFGLEVSHMGWICAANMIFVMLGVYMSKYSQKVLKSKRRNLFFAFLLLSLGVIGASYFEQLYLSLVMFFLHEIARGIFDPVMDSYLNERIESSNRATVLSFFSMISKLGAFSGLISSGLVAKYFGVQASWYYSASLVVIFLTYVACKKVRIQ